MCKIYTYSLNTISGELNVKVDDEKRRIKNKINCANDSFLIIATYTQKYTKNELLDLLADFVKVQIESLTRDITAIEEEEQRIRNERVRYKVILGRLNRMKEE